MNAVLGIVGALGLFLASFALHIAGGVTGQGWLFAIAVGLIFFFAVGFVWVATLLAKTRIRDAHRYFLIGCFGIALTLTGATLWAASDRSFEAWHAPAAPVLVFFATAALARAEAHWRNRA